MISESLHAGVYGKWPLLPSLYQGVCIVAHDAAISHVWRYAPRFHCRITRRRIPRDSIMSAQDSHMARLGRDDKLTQAS